MDSIQRINRLYWSTFYLRIEILSAKWCACEKIKVVDEMDQTPGIISRELKNKQGFERKKKKKTSEASLIWGWSSEPSTC